MKQYRVIRPFPRNDFKTPPAVGSLVEVQPSRFSDTWSNVFYTDEAGVQRTETLQAAEIAFYLTEANPCPK